MGLGQKSNLSKSQKNSQKLLKAISIFWAKNQKCLSKAFRGLGWGEKNCLKMFVLEGLATILLAEVQGDASQSKTLMNFPSNVSQSATPELYPVCSTLGMV